MKLKSVVVVPSKNKRDLYSKAQSENDTLKNLRQQNDQFNWWVNPTACLWLYSFPVFIILVIDGHFIEKDRFGRLIKNHYNTAFLHVMILQTSQTKLTKCQRKFPEKSSISTHRVSDLFWRKWPVERNWQKIRISKDQMWLIQKNNR